MKKKYYAFVFMAIAAASSLLIFLYEMKKIGGIKDLFDIEDDNEL
jgi:hypothetical protein